MKKEATPIRMVTKEDASKEFFTACEKVETKPTRRQWNKWKNKRGVAYKNR